jgi:plasmid stabilization system protein ParE
MNKKYHVEWAATAERDLKQVIDYIAIANPDNALQLLIKIRQKISSLYTLPERGSNCAGITRSRHTNLQGTDTRSMANYLQNNRFNRICFVGY